MKWSDHELASLQRRSKDNDLSTKSCQDFLQMFSSGPLVVNNGHRSEFSNLFTTRASSAHKYTVDKIRLDQLCISCNTLHSRFSQSLSICVRCVPFSPCLCITAVYITHFITTLCRCPFDEQRLPSVIF